MNNLISSSILCKLKIDGIIIALRSKQLLIAFRYEIKKPCYIIDNLNFHTYLNIHSYTFFLLKGIVVIGVEYLGMCML